MYCWSLLLFGVTTGGSSWTGSSGRPGSSKRIVFPLHLRRLPPRKGRQVENGSPAGASEGGIGLPSHLRKLIAKHSHPVELGNYDNVQYHLEIEIGKACGADAGLHQKFQVVPDTGSSDLWIPAVNCPKCTSFSARYDMKRSCTAKNIGDRVTFRYGDGTIAAGQSFTDRVIVGDLQVEDQFMIQVDDMQAITHMKSDGILGLAHHYASHKNARGRTFLYALFEEHSHLPNHFSFYLTGNANQNSSIVFGDADLPEHAKEDKFRYGKAYYMSHTSLWLTSVWSIGWSGTGVEVSFPDRGTLGAPALVDSGSSLIVLAPNIYDTLIRELKWRFTNCVEMPEQQILSCDCPPANDLSRIPELVINVIDGDDRQFSLCMSPEEYILQSMDPLSLGQSCVPALQRGSDEQPVPIILGMTFMRSFYTTFDVKQHRIGFARSKLSPMPGNAQCSSTSQPLQRRVLWLASVVIASISVIFACYVLLLPAGCARTPTVSALVAVEE